MVSGLVFFLRCFHFLHIFSDLTSNLDTILDNILRLFLHPFSNLFLRSGSEWPRLPAEATPDTSQVRGEPRAKDAPRKHPKGTQEAPRRHPGAQGASEGISLINHHHSHAKCKKLPRLNILPCVFEGPSRIHWYLLQKCELTAVNVAEQASRPL